MLYLNEEDVKNIQPSWETLLGIIENAIDIWSFGHFSQPLKPYLSFENPKNRIIAMPAYLGRSCNSAGIKWIASFPENIQRGMQRAHSITLLNNADTGEPLTMIQSSSLSGIRTAAVSGIILRRFVENIPSKTMHIGIVGFGPIGELHLKMITELIETHIDSIKIYDVREEIRNKIPSCARAVNTWQEAYEDADIFITCTTTADPYINILPKSGSLHLNVSLRDYTSNILKKCAHIIVDDWDEVCRANTDIERTHKAYGLQKKDTVDLRHFCKENYFKTINQKAFLESEFCSFHPMGMAIFDIALAKYYYSQACEAHLGTWLSS